MDLSSLKGGTEAADVPPALFAMGDGEVIRYDRPAAAIADYVTGYHLYAARGAGAKGREDWFLPGAANVRVTLDAGPASVSIRRRRFDLSAPAMLFGPTSRALHARTNGGMMVGFGLSALGWGRLFHQPADRFHNLVVPLALAAGPDLPRRLCEALRDAPDEHAVKPVLDALLEPLLARPGPDEPLVRAAMALIVDPDMIRVDDLVERLGAHKSTVRRLCARGFGMAPKLLLRRARFLRSLVAMLRDADPIGYAGIDRSYHDASHFLRDADFFLGTTPRRFLERANPFLLASIRVRAPVLGTPTQALHDVATAPAAR